MTKIEQGATVRITEPGYLEGQVGTVEEVRLAFLGWPTEYRVSVEGDLYTVNENDVVPAAI